MARILIVGCGYIGCALGRQLRAQGDCVWGLRRRIDRLCPGLQPICADLTDPSTLADLPADLDAVFYTASAGVFNDEAYEQAYVKGPRNLIRALEGQGRHPRRLIFTSSTSVYAQTDGQWVDEASPVEPDSFSGQRLLQGERLVLDAPFASTVLRLGGIYGPGRDRMIEQVRQGKASCFEGPPIYSNRIYRDDCVGALIHLMRLEKAEGLFVGVDDAPTDPCEILRWLAGQLGAPGPRLGQRPPSTLSRTMRSNKRCRNRKLTESGYSFKCPTYREGFLALLSESAG